jgi:hypothetical protein
MSARAEETTMSSPLGSFKWSAFTIPLTQLPGCLGRLLVNDETGQPGNAEIRVGVP